MRRIVILVGPLVAAVFAFACEDDPSSNPEVQFPEAGTFDSYRPPTDGSTPVDGGLPDGDAAPAPKNVTVVVGNSKGPRPGVVVVFHDATGAVVETKTTDALGRASSNPAGPVPAMATALLGKDTSNRQLLTWTALEAGDELLAADPEDQSSLGDYSITLPSLLLDAGGVAADTYYAYVGNCVGQNNDTPVPLTMYSSCGRALNAPIVYATNGGGPPLGFAFKKNVPSPADGGVVDVSGLNAWVAPATFTVTLQNKPGVIGPNAALLEIANDVATPNYSAYGLDGADQAQFKVAPGYADAYQATINVPGSANGVTRTMTTRYAANATTATFDFQQALPELSTITVDETSVLRPSFSWTSATTLAGSDGGYVRARFYMQNEDHVEWTFIVPPGTTTGTVKAPALPATEAAGFLPDPDAGANTWLSARATFAEADALADYKAFRKSTGISIQAAGTPIGFLPANGSYKTTEIVNFGQTL